MVSQYLSELDKKYRSNPYSTLKDLQAEHLRLRYLLKDIESEFEIKILKHLDNHERNKLARSQLGITDLTPTILEQYRGWLNLYKKRNRLRGLLSYLACTVASKEALLSLPESQVAVTRKGTSSEPVINELDAYSLRSLLDTTIEETQSLKTKYSYHRKLLDSRNRTLLTTGSVDRIEQTLRILTAATKLEEDGYEKLLHDHEMLAQRVEIERVEMQRMIAFDEEKIKAALGNESRFREETYWKAVEKWHMLTKAVKNFSEELTE
jgi:hypothetical protein